MHSHIQFSSPAFLKNGSGREWWIVVMQVVLAVRKNYCILCCWRGKGINGVIGQIDVNSSLVALFLSALS